MAHINLLSAADIAARGNPTRKRTGRKRSAARNEAIEAAKEVLRTAEPGWAGDVVLDEGEDKKVVRRNLKDAASELGLHLEFRPIKDAMRISFRVISEEQQAAKPKRPGRPMKAVD